MHGERYLKTPEFVQKFIRNLPITDVAADFILFKPLLEVDRSRETPVSVIFFADPDQLSALVVLANYNREDNENVIIPYAAACQTIGIHPYREAKNNLQRDVIGLTDLSARIHCEGSFLDRRTWQSLVQAKE